MKRAPKKKEVSPEVTKKISEKVSKRKPLDPRVKDLRHKVLYLNPYSGWIPEGAKQTIMNIVDRDGEMFGELEIGDDGFVQIATLNDRHLVRITYYPGRNHATISKVSVEG